MTDSTVIRILMILCLIQGSVYSDGIFHSVENCWSYQFHTQFFSSDPTSRREFNLGDLVKKTLILACIYGLIISNLV